MDKLNQYKIIIETQLEMIIGCNMKCVKTTQEKPRYNWTKQIFSSHI